VTVDGWEQQLSAQAVKALMYVNMTAFKPEKIMHYLILIKNQAGAEYARAT